MNALSEINIKRGLSRATSALAAALHQQQERAPTLVPRLPGALANPEQLAADLVEALVPATRRLNRDELIIGMGELPRAHRQAKAEAEAETAAMALLLAEALKTGSQEIQVAALDMAMQALHGKPTAARLLYVAGDRVFNEGR